MDTHFYYMAVNLGCVGVPFIFSFHPKLNFFKNWKALLVGTIAMMALFIPWDIYFTANGIWSFNPKYVTGKFIYGLPIEEWLFFICIPYACVFTYSCMKLFLPKNFSSKFLTALLYATCFTFLIVAATHTERWYTFAAHLLSGLFLALHLFIFKTRYLATFMLTFLIILVPFLASNGILTGVTFWDYSFINFDVDNITEKIVSYNNEHNLRLRLFSMPIDDIAYGMLMLLLTTTVYEKVLSSIRKPSSSAIAK